MADDLKRFAGRIQLIGKRIEKNADEVVRKVALAVDAAVVMATPVDTGRARANWQVNINEPASGTREAFIPGKEGSTGGQNARAAIIAGQVIIQGYKPKEGEENSIHITNNLPYIGRLNDGWSAQAPAGFVERAVLTGVSAVRGTGSLLKNLKDE